MNNVDLMEACIITQGKTEESFTYDDTTDSCLKKTLYLFDDDSIANAVSVNVERVLCCMQGNVDDDK